MIDNFDSFVYNLDQYLGALGAETRVIRNEASLSEISDLEPAGLVISPGPGRPEDAGICIEAIKHFAPLLPILGVCLGHQAIGSAFGGQIVTAPILMHGKTSEIHHTSKGVFRDLPNPFVATRYHSLIIDPDTVGEDLEVTARTADEVIMGIRHRDYPLEGVQFHPESVLTSPGMNLIENFLKGTKDWQRAGPRQS